MSAPAVPAPASFAVRGKTGMWAFFGLVLLFVVALWVVGKLRKQTLVLKPQANGEFLGIITERFQLPATNNNQAA